MTDTDTLQKIHVEVVLAKPERQELVALDIDAGLSVADAIVLSGLVEKFKGFDLDLGSVGIFGKKVSADQILRDGDRVEIYRPLIADPKESRRARALKQSTP